MKQTEVQIRRREFLARSSVAATLGASALACGVEDVIAMEAGRDLLYSDFVDAMGSEFAVPQSGATLTLTEITRQRIDRGRPAHVRRTGFSLLFEIKAGSLDNGTHLVAHSRMPSRHVLLQNVSADGRLFEAVYG